MVPTNRQMSQSCALIAGISGASDATRLGSSGAADAARQGSSGAAPTAHPQRLIALSSSRAGSFFVIIWGVIIRKKEPAQELLKAISRWGCAYGAAPDEP